MQQDKLPQISKTPFSVEDILDPIKFTGKQTRGFNQGSTPENTGEILFFSGALGSNTVLYLVLTRHRAEVVPVVVL